jgi:hypothetical protein
VNPSLLSEVKCDVWRHFRARNWYLHLVILETSLREGRLMESLTSTIEEYYYFYLLREKSKKWRKTLFLERDSKERSFDLLRQTNNIRQQPVPLESRRRVLSTLLIPDERENQTDMTQSPPSLTILFSQESENEEDWIPSSDSYSCWSYRLLPHHHLHLLPSNLFIWILCLVESRDTILLTLFLLVYYKLQLSPLFLHPSLL